MAESIASITVAATLKAVLQNAIDGGNADAASVALGKALVPATALATGTSANQADRIWQDTARALTSGSSETLNLYSFTGIDIGGGSGNDALGIANANVEIVAILIRNISTSVGNLLVGGEGTSNAWTDLFNGVNTDKLVIKPGGFILVFCPADPAYTVGSSSNNLLKFAASGGAVSYDCIVLSRSA